MIPWRFHNGELRRKIKKVFSYFLWEGNLWAKLTLHAEALRALKPYRRSNLIAFRAQFIYILPFVAKSLNAHQKHRILTHHYDFLDSHFSKSQLKQLFTRGILCYKEFTQGEGYSIYLQAITSHLEFEGSLSLNFKRNGNSLYNLGFTVVTGEELGEDDTQLLFISSLQGTKKGYEAIRNATKHFSDNSLPIILLTALQAVAANFNITKCIGVSMENQLSYHNDSNYDRFYTTYDLFWINAGGRFINGNYLIDFPVRQKPLHLIKQTHRNRTVKKRKKLDEIYQAVLTNQLFIDRLKN